MPGNVVGAYLSKVKGSRLVRQLEGRLTRAFVKVAMEKEELLPSVKARGPDKVFVELPIGQSALANKASLKVAELSVDEVNEALISGLNSLVPQFSGRLRSLVKDLHGRLQAGQVNSEPRCINDLPKRGEIFCELGAIVVHFEWNNVV